MLKSTYTVSDANHNLGVARKKFNADDFKSVVELHLNLCFCLEAELFEEMNQIAEEYNFNIDSFDFMSFPHIPAYRWNMEQAIINRDSQERSMAGASIRVVEHIQDRLYENFYLFEEIVKK